MLLPTQVTIGHIISMGNISIHIGHRNELKYFPIGLPLYNIDDIYIKSAGAYGSVIQQQSKHTLIKMPSNKILRFKNK